MKIFTLTPETQIFPTCHISPERTFGSIGGLIRDRDNKIWGLSCGHSFLPKSYPGIIGSVDLWALDEEGIARNIGVVIKMLKGESFEASLIQFADEISFKNPYLTQKARSSASMQKGLEVWKLGAGSGLTRGLIAEVNQHQMVLYPNLKKSEFTGLAFVQAQEGSTGHFSVPGDSGSIAYDTAGNALGMILGGGSEMSWLMPISPILNALDATIA